MRKLLLSILTMATLGASAQIPSGSYLEFEFTSGSLNNTSSSGAANLSGVSPNSIADRFGDAANAIDIQGALNGPVISSSSTTATTLCFWMKHSSLGSIERILQMYNGEPTGYRLDMDGSLLSYNTQVADASNPSSGGATVVNTTVLDDNNWHHVAIRTSPVSTTEMEIEIFIDNVIQTLVSNPTYTLTNPIAHFVENASFILSPTNNYTGDIDDIYFYESALTNVQISKIYNYGVSTLIYVDKDATGANDGTSWADAFTNLQGTFNQHLHYKDEVWVAEGTYLPTTGSNQNFRFVWSKDKVEVYGGFNGTETSRSQRDWVANRTIMSGDIGVQGDSSDNTYNVCVGPAGNINNQLTYGLLDGFVIQDGNAYNGVYNQTGAGIMLENYIEKFVINNCEISNNTARHGTAVYARAYKVPVELELNNCIIKNNEGRYGVGIEVESKDENMIVKISNCLYENNTVKDMPVGAGTNSIVYVKNTISGAATLADVEITNTTFANNKNIGTHLNDNEGLIQCYSANTIAAVNLTCYNTIFWGNTGDTTTLVKHPSSNAAAPYIAEFHYCISDFTDFSDATATSNILNSDPLFTNTTAGDFTLQSGSPAIDAGVVTGLTIPTTDLAGNARVVGSQIDLGCYEFDISTNIESSLQKLDLTIYPNPATTQLNIDNGGLNIENITILDITGKTVKTIVSGVNIVDVSDLTRGIYLIQIRTENGLVNKKFIKE